ncbi:unnamed protein product, partial [Rotaria magnacalcarata]|jgi:CBS domain-containing protein
MDA